jgi:tetratricopeptide (TPR) repeat protein
MKYRNLKAYLFLFLTCLFWVKSTHSNTLTLEEMERTPENVLFRSAVDLFNKGKYEDALKYWRFLVINNPNKAIYYFNYANTHYELKNYKAASHGYKKVKLLKSPLTPAANLFIAKSYQKMGKEELAIKELRGLTGSAIPLGIRSEAKKMLAELDIDERERQERVRKKKLSAPLDFPLGLTFFKRQNYTMAAIHLEKAAKTYEEAELYLVKGICYFKMSKFKRAKKDLNKAIKLTTDPDIRKNANALLALMKKQRDEVKLGRQNLIFSVDLSLNFNSSPFAVSTIDRDTKDSQAILYTELGWRLWKSKNTRGSISYEGSFEESLKTSEDRFVEHTGMFSFNANARGMNFNIVPKYIRQESGKEPYASKYGGNIRVSKKLANKNRVNMEYQNLENKSLGENTDYLNGTGEYLRLGWGRRGDRFDLSFNLTHSKDSFKDEPANVLSNTGNGATASLVIYPVEQFSINTSLNFLSKEYKRDPESNFLRKDKSTSISFGLSYNMKSGVGIYMNTNLSFVDSNLDEGVDPQNISAVDEIFDFQETVAIGVTWSY